MYTENVFYTFDDETVLRAYLDHVEELVSEEYLKNQR